MLPPFIARLPLLTQIPSAVPLAGDDAAVYRKIAVVDKDTVHTAPGFQAAAGHGQNAGVDAPATLAGGGAGDLSAVYCQVFVNTDAVTIGAIGGAVLGGFLGNTIGGGTGRSLATAAGAVAGGVAGQGVQGAMNKTQGVELEIRKDDGNTIMVVQKQGSTPFSVGQRVAIAGSGSQVTVSPR